MACDTFTYKPWSDSPQRLHRKCSFFSQHWNISMQENTLVDTMLMSGMSLTGQNFVFMLDPSVFTAFFRRVIFISRCDISESQVLAIYLFNHKWFITCVGLFIFCLWLIFSFSSFSYQQTFNKSGKIYDILFKRLFFTLCWNNFLMRKARMISSNILLYNLSIINSSSFGNIWKIVICVEVLL